jgi:V/A-type H+/Na+-transporting ATPase subunit G/H
VKEIIQKILETEKEARDGIERAREEAQQIVREAEEKSRQVEEGVRTEAMQKAHSIMERMKEEAEGERKQQVERAQVGSTEIIKKKKAEIEAAAGCVTNLILGIEEKQPSLFDK